MAYRSESPSARYRAMGSSPWPDPTFVGRPWSMERWYGHASASPVRAVRGSCCVLLAPDVCKHPPSRSWSSIGVGYPKDCLPMVGEGRAEDFCVTVSCVGSSAREEGAGFKASLLFKCLSSGCWAGMRWQLWAFVVDSECTAHSSLKPYGLTPQSGHLNPSTRASYHPSAGAASPEPLKRNKAPVSAKTYSRLTRVWAVAPST